MSDPKNPTAPPSRDFGYGMERLETSPGARKEKLRQRAYSRPRGRSKPRYAELHVASAFSFLEGASQPEDLVERAAALELPAVALVDRMGVYGSPRFHKAASEAGIRPLVGSTVVFADPNEKRTKARTTRREASRRLASGHPGLESRWARPRARPRR